ncbi:DUF1345 domain-containing protein [Epidermidibacterium keratini]|uniref:DUF1345 domain-containing protein n=1 Tax=Epidermidibacterium keratini TaxID=1891644 RepID=A0A7L4YN73_9ACTN|nr:DUF1345 domain-containing protein [Epidermidibacterium keratini]QHC00528.1 DUF1345 domain-containing protein [Epidermidibacterium keratini]
MATDTARSTKKPEKHNRYHGWLSERRRAGTSLLVALVAAIVVIILRAQDAVFTGADGGVIVLLAYLVTYMLITLKVFSQAPDAEVREWAHRDSRGTVLQRYILGTAPGPGISLFISAAAMAVAVVWMPGYGGTSLPTSARIGVALSLVVVAWVCVMISFAVAFHADNLVEDGKGLDFPGSAGVEWADYIYFAVSVMTTFGTTDVSVTSPEMRRTVTGNAVIAFIFNTITVAAVVSALTG